ncbi:MAG: Holliday junction helicase RuvA, holliday junction helicase RuvA [Patescibacteria group bacterium]|nr:Holliday junction helicase RuvA, holliday junction helicase RuvA [Patescibacteria group bacterium]
MVVETGGLAYRVFVTAETAVRKSVGDEVVLWTAHIVREDSQELYGFENTSDQDLFELLLGVSGIGPKSALGVMNVATIGTIARAVQNNDVSYLTKISGIGRKTAEKILIELRDKLPDIHYEGSETAGDALDALIALGYTDSASRDILRTISAELDTQARIREALRLLNGK